MLELFRSSTARLENELAEIEATLANLADDRENLRLDRGWRIVHRGAATDTKADREVREMSERIATLDEAIRAKRARRREIQDALRPVSAGAAAIAGVPMPAALVAAQDALNQARLERAELLSETTTAFNAGKDTAPSRLRDKVDAIEDRIQKLRVERAAQLEPYHRALADALRPVVVKAASDLLAASRAFIEAHSVLREAAQALPGGPSQIAAAIDLDPAGAQRGEQIAAGILDVWAGAEAVAAE